MMRAAVQHELGSAPEPGEFREPPADVAGTLVEVAAAGLNPVDLFIATGKMLRVRPVPPCVGGLEGVGRRRDDGARVYFGETVQPFGSFAERALADPAQTFAVPDGVDDATALCLGIAGMAGWIALEWRARLQPGEGVLILGASGNVGRIAVQAAKLLGAGRVIAAARNETALAELTERGADATVAITADGFADALRDAAPDGIDLILDPVWGATAMAALSAASPGARLIQVGNASGLEAELPVPALRDKHVSIVGYTNFRVPAAVKGDAFQRMCRHAAAGELWVEHETIPLGEIESAWRRQAASPNRKLVVAVRE